MARGKAQGKRWPLGTSLYSTWAPSFGPRVPSSCCKRWGVSGGGICSFLVRPPPLPTTVSVSWFERFQTLSNRGNSPVPKSVSKSRPWESGRYLRSGALAPGKARCAHRHRSTCEGCGHSWQRPRWRRRRGLPRHGLHQSKQMNGERCAVQLNQMITGRQRLCPQIHASLFN